MCYARWQALALLRCNSAFIATFSPSLNTCIVLLILHNAASHHSLLAAARTTACVSAIWRYDLSLAL